MISNKISVALKMVLVIVAIILALGAGLTFGYRYILSQNDRLNNYDNQVKAAEAAATAPPSPTPYPTDENGNVILPTDEAGNPIETQFQPTATPTPKINPKDVIVLDAKSPGAVMIYVALGDSTKDIAKKLHDKNLIEDVTLFNIFSKFNGFDGGYQYGTHFVRKGMSFDQIMYILTQKPATETIYFPEDLTYADMKKILSENNIHFDEAKLDALVKSPTAYTDYSFVRQIPTMSPSYDPSVSGVRDNALQGYLFPDTYRFDLNADEDTIVRTFLNNTNSKLDDSYYERAAYLGMSMDQVITLASIIQKESGSLEDMYKVSRVFHNRIHSGYMLQSCATVNYGRKKMGKAETFIVSTEDMAMNDPYNTYKNIGLPPGPICSPSLKAIKAALYPTTDPNFINLYYFVATGDGKTNVFANTVEEQEQNIQTYLVPLQEGATP